MLCVCSSLDLEDCASHCDLKCDAKSIIPPLRVGLGQILVFDGPHFSLVEDNDIFCVFNEAKKK